MKTGKPEGLQLTEEEAFALLSLCLVSSGDVDRTTSLALQKLARYCSQGREESYHSGSGRRAVELVTMGA